jgi:hypothetical protein
MALDSPSLAIADLSRLVARVYDLADYARPRLAPRELQDPCIFTLDLIHSMGQSSARAPLVSLRAAP